MKACPKCGVEQPTNVELCACGHWFKHSNSVESPQTQPNKINISSNISSVVISSIVLLLLFIIGSFAKELGRESAESVQRAHNATQADQNTAGIAQALNQHLPISVNSDMRWDNVVADDGKTLIFKYTLTGLKSSEINHQNIDSKIQEVAHAACIADDSRRLIQDGITLEYRYFGADDVNIGGISVNRSYCLQYGSN